MPDSFNIDEPDDIIAEPDDQAGNETPPELLAIQASPAIVELAEQIHLAFLKSLQPRVTMALGCDTRTVYIGTDQSSLARYLTEPEPGIHQVILSLAPLAGCVIMRFSSELLYKALDILLASPADATGARGESITEIEFHLLRGFFRVFEEVMKETWRSVPGVALTVLPGLTEENFHAYGESHALAMKSTLVIGGASGEFDVIIPAFLARLSARLSRHGEAGTIPAPARITEVLGSAKVELDAVLSNLTIRIGDLLELGPGQVLLTEKGAESGFECLVNKRTGFRGELVSAGDRYGFQLGAFAGEADSPTDR